MSTMIGVVYTNKIGSECEFDLDVTSEEWNKMSEEEQSKLLVACMWESGMVDVYAKEEGE